MDVGKIEKDGESLKLTILDHPFRKAGGGQPCDLGRIKGEGFEAEVLDVTSEDTLLVKLREGKIKEGKVECSIDEIRKTRLTRMHTGEHILFKALEKYVKGLKLEKIRLGEKESTLTVFADIILWNHIFAAERLVNEIIVENREVIAHDVKKDDVDKFEGLRIKKERIKEETIRVVEIVGYDFSACKGTHCSKTGEVKNLLVTSLNSAGKGKFEIKFKIDVVGELFSLSEKTRTLSSILVVDIGSLEGAVSNMKEELEKYKKIARKQKIDIQQEKVGDVKFYYTVTENADKKQLMNQAKELLGRGVIVCFMNNTEKGVQMMLMSSAERVDASVIVKDVCEKFGGKGGGKKEFAMCSFAGEYIGDVLELVKRFLN